MCGDCSEVGTHTLPALLSLGRWHSRQFHCFGPWTSFLALKKGQGPLGTLKAMSAPLHGGRMDASHISRGDCRILFLQLEGRTCRPIELCGFSWKIIFSALILIKEEKN